MLEHPAYSDAWAAFDLPRPQSSGWQRGLCGGWSAHVEQGRYGHPAKKATWLYAYGCDLPDLDWRRGSHSGVWVGWCGNNNRGRTVERVSKKDSSETPLPFRDLLIAMARSCHRQEVSLG